MSALSVLNLRSKMLYSLSCDTRTINSDRKRETDGELIDGRQMRTTVC
jgi:hypothetical protein